MTVQVAPERATTVTERLDQAEEHERAEVVDGNVRLEESAASTIQDVVDGVLAQAFQVPTDRRGIWRTVAASAGDSELVVEAPRPFRVVPNDLRGFSTLRD